MSKRNKVIYWIATIWLALGMSVTGVGQMVKMKAGQGGMDMVAHLGYPTYLLSLLGIWKVLGVVAILVPKAPLVKEWAYAGFIFLMTSAAYSHIATGDPVMAIAPATLLLALTVISWYMRPADRRLY